jgi:hypothetical protein
LTFRNFFFSHGRNDSLPWIHGHKDFKGIQGGGRLRIRTHVNNFRPCRYVSQSFCLLANAFAPKHHPLCVCLYVSVRVRVCVCVCETVAVGYAMRKGQTSGSLLMKIVTRNNLERGADVVRMWISSFPPI